MHGNVCIPSHRYRGRGRTKTTFVDTLKRDTGTASVGELATLMGDRDEWRTHVRARLRPS